ncbi:LuxE/PaaK family acyltransferase [Spongiivirga citrea]|uniref:Acyl transferase n=1 Tax=Spongiivirga citrea TaxID=1481457 RepID=A0A6M0CHG8_9FLAO|nr:acyl transferase [Spongiivirga citrea]NER16952.1 acyl transferase [Spongiivirga citrea]
MRHDIFSIKTDDDFKKAALATFAHQFENNGVYRAFCDLLYRHPSDVHRIEDIPFLPIQFFKSHKVVSTNTSTFHEFTSSGTTGNTSTHFVSDLSLYEKSYQNGFNHFYGDIEDYALLALLPSYLERSGSSLIYMVDDFIKKSSHPKSGFYLDNIEELSNTLMSLEKSGQRTLLIGVSFALLDLVEKMTFNLKHTTVMETGGMKGRRKELTRKELHDKLKKGFGVATIHSEYGMTELLSQAYSLGNGVFACPPWMRVTSRETDDPLTIQATAKTGGLNIIDLANYNSCSFIATQDLGKVQVNGNFEVLGRFDHADIRGCNLMVL